MLNLIYALDHQNYERYCSYQHLYFTNLTTTNLLAYQELKNRGFGSRITRDMLSSVHVELITEYFKKDMRKTAGPFRYESVHIQMQ